MAVAEDVLFKAIAHPARRQMLALLAAESLSVKELTLQFSMSQPAVSQHLRELREAQLVVAERVGIEQRYRLTASPLRAVYEWSSQYRRFFDPSGHAWGFVAANRAEDEEGLGGKPEKQKKKEKRKHGR